MKYLKKRIFTWRNKSNGTKKINVSVKRPWLAFLVPSITGVLVFVLAPFADVVRRSFVTAVLGQWAGVGNYLAVFGNKAFRLAVRNTVKFTLVCIPLLIAVGLLLSALLSRLQGIQLIKDLFLFPLAIPSAVIVLVWKMLFCGYTDSFRVLVFSYLWRNLGYTMVLWLAGIFAIPRSIIDAAMVDGAGEIQCFFRVILPNLKGSFFTIAVLSFLNSFKVFREAYLVAGAYPDESIYLLQHLFNNWFVNLELDKMAAASVLMAGVLFGAILLFLRYAEKDI